jgi:hypothetical protein
MLRKLFFRKPPDGLLEICERVYGTFFLSLSFFNSFNCTFLLKKPPKLISLCYFVIHNSRKNIRSMFDYNVENAEFERE